MSLAQKNYQSLHAISRNTKVLSGIQAILGWDQETYMPEKAAGIRGEQLKVLAGIIHKEQTSKKFSNALGKIIDLKTGKIIQTGLSLEQEAAAREWHRDYLKATALPPKFVKEFAKLRSASIFAWDSAKKRDNFQEFLPHLEKMIEMARKRADYLGYKDHPYDALLDLYEPHMTTKEVAALFRPLRQSTIQLLKKIQSAKQIDDKFLHQTYPIKKQEEFNQELLKILDYPSSQGRLDLSAHPFSTSSHPTDSRITTRLSPRLPISNIRSVMHECGHAFYEMGLPIEHFGSPLGESISLGIHESQSRWWETRIGLSQSFWKHTLPILKRYFPKNLDKANLNTFWKAINKVEPSFIRVEADEVTYSLHIILRFELEIALIEGKLSPKDIPEAWNAKMKELLGITPKKHSEGCLQDIHWSMGAFGYFPTYTLGNLYCAPLFCAFEKEHSDWEKRLEKGELGFIKEWLQSKVHCHGRRYSPKELLKKVTGKSLTTKPFETYLADKYSHVYSI